MFTKLQRWWNRPDPDEFILFIDSDKQRRYIRRRIIHSVNLNDSGSVWLRLTDGEEVWLDDAHTRYAVLQSLGNYWGELF